MTVEEIIDRLYGLPLAEFTKARNEAAGELRKDGQRDAAERVKSLPKPTVVAATVNRLVREHRGEVEQFLRAAAALRDAQFAGKGDLATATEQEREELDRLVGAGGEAVRQTLLAAAADEDAARQLLDARLAQELELRGFGTLLAHVATTPAAPSGTPTSPTGPVSSGSPTKPAPSAAPARAARTETKKPDDRAALARLQNARAALGIAETSERRARGRWQETQQKLEKTRSAVVHAERDVEQARAVFDKAKRDAAQARAALEEAQRDLDRRRRD